MLRFRALILVPPIQHPSYLRLVACSKNIVTFSLLIKIKHRSNVLKEFGTAGAADFYHRLSYVAWDTTARQSVWGQVPKGQRRAGIRYRKGRGHDRMTVVGGPEYS
jgi:hypothetical protein